LRVLELYAGSRSIGKVAESRGHEVCSVDIKAFEGIDIVADIEFLSLADLPWIPDMIWASPPCTTYSIAAISHHRNGVHPKTEFAAKSDRLVMNTLKLIDQTTAIYYVENPRGALRIMPFMLGSPKVTVWYCAYGDHRAKPTDIWSNNIRGLLNTSGEWIPRPECRNGNPFCHHDRSPRGSRTGTQGLKGNYERSKLPEELCIDIIKSAEQRYEKLTPKLP
jgi:hypothetical protein